EAQYPRCRDELEDDVVCVRALVMVLEHPAPEVVLVVDGSPTADWALDEHLPRPGKNALASGHEAGGGRLMEPVAHRLRLVHRPGKEPERQQHGGHVAD